MNKCIGIIGGMGPMATCDLMQKMICHMKAESDQEHIRICVDCNTNIPDRTEAILNRGENPLPEMTKSAIRLQSDGADVLTISCNTAHWFFDELSKYVDIPIIHMPRETAKYLKKNKIKSAAVLATDGTVLSGIYEKALLEEEIRCLYPNCEEQKLVMTLIYECIKAGKPFDSHVEKIRAMIQNLRDRGAEVFVLGCTELPILFDSLTLEIPAIDPTEILAISAIEFCGGAVQ